MDDQSADGFTHGIDYKIHPKLKQDCQVGCFKLPFVQAVRSITARRHSIRLQTKILPSMKEPKAKKKKKRTKKSHLIDKQEVVLLENTSNTIATSSDDSQTSSNQQLDLSDSEIINLINDVVSFIEDGFGDSTFDLLNEDIQSDANITSVQSFSDLQPTSICTQTMSKQSISTGTDLQLTSISTQPVSQQTISTETDSPIRCSIAIQTDFDNQRSVATQYDFDNQMSVATQTDIGHQRSESTQTSSAHQRSQYCQTSFEIKPATDTDSQPTIATKEKLLKRKGSICEHKSNKTFIRDYDLINCSVNRGLFDFTKPVECLPVKSEKIIPLTSHTDFGSSKCLIATGDFNSMKVDALKLLQKPCLKFLKFEKCGSYCQHNHFLPAATVVAEAIANWPDEKIDFFYMTYIQRYKMCHMLYFAVICNTYSLRLLPKRILATCKDVERMSTEAKNFKIIFLSLLKCGYSFDDGLFAICTHAHRSENTMNQILKIIITFGVAKFKKTIAFLVTIIDTYDFDPCFGDEILKQASQVATPDVTLLEFCCDIVRKFPNILSEQYMKILLSKM